MEQPLSQLVNRVVQGIPGNADEQVLHDLASKIKDGLIFWSDLEIADALKAAGISASQIAGLYEDSTLDKTPILQHLLDELSKATLEDVLTKVYNRRYFERSLATELERSRRDQRPCGLVLLDIDHFKRINDTHGHDAGDAVLKAVAATITSVLRSTDTISRVGGEEFAVIVPNTFRLDADYLAERIRRSIEELAVSVGDKVLSVTVSLGVAINNPKVLLAMEDLYKAADNALYEAKSSGRNCVKFSVSTTAKTSSAVTADERNELLG